MFGLFKTSPFRDAVLGEFNRSRGHWRGAIALEGAAAVPLVLSGGRTEPDTQAIAIARTLASTFIPWRSSIELALFEHYGPYAETLVAGEHPPTSESFPNITTPSQVWPYVSLVYVSVTPLGGRLATEFGYTTAWDEEHTLGARFQAGEFVELCGSVLSP
jgi:hypothetical protein